MTHVTHINGWFPAVYMSNMSQNFRLFLVSNLSVLNFPFFGLCIRGLYGCFGVLAASRCLSVFDGRCFSVCVAAAFPQTYPPIVAAQPLILPRQGNSATLSYTLALSRNRSVARHERFAPPFSNSMGPCNSLRRSDESCIRVPQPRDGVRYMSLRMAWP